MFNVTTLTNFLLCILVFFIYLCVPCYCDACFSIVRCVWEWKRYTIQTFNKPYENVFGILPGIYRKFTWEWKFCLYSATVRTNTFPGIIQLWFNYFAASSFKALGNDMHFSLEAKERCPGSCRRIHSCLPCEWGRSPQSANLSAPSENTRPPDTHTSAKELCVRSRLLPFPLGILSQLAVFPNFSILTTKELSAQSAACDGIFLP